MDISSMMNPVELSKTQYDVDAFNKSLNGGKAYKPSLDKDDFLKILITQLQNQDPTKPLEDKEFIAQMAQFSSLEQMTNMSKEFGKVSGVLRSNEAQTLLGRKVEIANGESTVSGMVTQVMRGDFPMVKVNGTFFDLNQVQKVIDDKEATL
jgi:flagellar basal-body rod modification protein FlgD